MFGGLLAPTEISTIANVFVNALLAAAIVVSAVALFRLLRRREPPPAVRLAAAPAPLAGWTDWLRRAQAAAASGSWRDAVHLTYWCAVAFLEAKGAWRPDGARTPREYVRLLPSSHNA